MKNTILCSIWLLLAACSGTTTERVALAPEANDCQVTESRPTSLSTLTFVVCWDDSGTPIGMAGGAGEPAIGPPLSILSAGAVVGGAYVLGSEIGSGWTVDVQR